MLVAVRAQVESADHWRTQFKTHADLFRSQGVSVAHMGSADEKTVLAIFETNDVVVVFPCEPEIIIFFFNETMLASTSTLS